MASVVVSGNVARISGSGVVIVASDLHGNLADYETLEHLFLDVWEQSDAPTRPVLLLLGDVFHGPPEDLKTTPPGMGYPDQSATVFRRLVVLARDYPANVISLLGNHEHAHVGGPPVQKFGKDEALEFESKLTPERVVVLHDWLERWPLVAVTDGGVVMSHAAAPARRTTYAQVKMLNRDGFEDLRPIDFVRNHLLGEVLWRRGATLEQTRRWVGLFADSPDAIHVHGHDIAERGVAWQSPQELCLGTSFGVHQSEKRILILPNQARFTDRLGFAESGVIRKLRPNGT